MSAKSILMQIAIGDTYDTEYDGRMYTRCRYCDACLSERDQHDEGCLTFEARKSLGQVWIDHLNQEKEAQEKAQREEQQRYERMNAYRQKVKCEFCGTKVAKCGLKEHQAASVKCKVARGLIPAVVKPVVDSNTRRCSHCNKLMPGAHPNKKFCSNSGAGNCKDAHHNKNNPRGLGLIASELRAAKRELTAQDRTDFDYGLFEEDDHPFSEGWDGHKEY